MVDLNSIRPRKILSIPTDNSAIERTVIMKSADGLGTPSKKTKEESIRDTSPDPI